MKAVRAVIVSEQKLEFEEFDLPDKPGPYQVLVQVQRTVISAGTELAIYTGLEPETKVKGAWCAHPWNPGYGGLGRVLAVGENVHQVNPAIKPGNRVYGMFQHASHTAVDVNRGLCVPVPDGLDSTLAVMARMCSVAITAYQRSRVSLGDTVVIIGLGMVGNLAGQYYVQSGQRVVGIDLAASRRALAKDCGYLDAIDPSGKSEAALFEAVAKVFGGAAPRVVVDAVGDSGLIGLSVRMADTHGQVVLLGTPRAPFEGDATPVLKAAHLKFLDILGALEWTIPMFKRQSTGPTSESNAGLIFDMIGRGQLKVAPLCSHVIAPAKLNDAYQGLLHRKDEYVGVVLDWENNDPPATTR